MDLKNKFPLLGVVLVVLVFMFFINLVSFSEIEKFNSDGEEGLKASLVLIEEESLPVFDFTDAVKEDVVKVSSTKSKKDSKSSSNKKISLSSEKNVEEENVGAIFKINGEQHIMRDESLYKIASNEIKFNPALPSSICVGEYIDVKIDLGTVNLNWGITDSDYVTCVLNGKKDILVEYCLMEDDGFSNDEEIKCLTGTATTYDCATINLENYQGVVVKREFNNVKFSDYFTGIEDPWTIEVYAKVYNPHKNYFYAYSTDNFDIDKVNCDCFAGDCCDVSSRPYLYRDSNYVCNDEYSLDYGCPDGTGTSNPGADVFKKTKKKHCSGTSQACDGLTSSWSVWKLYDSCSLNEYCTDNDESCNSCGYNTNKKCYDNDVYWYDNCNNKEEKKEECGTDGCENGACKTGGCPNSVCGGFCGDYSGFPQWRFYNLVSGEEDHYPFCNGDCKYSDIEFCENGCENGACKSAIACSQDSDCGTNGDVGSLFCSSDDVFQKYRTHTCNNPKEESSYCSSSDQDKRKEDCGVSGYSGNKYCSSGDVYQDYVNKGCSNGACYSNVDKKKQEDCGANGCENGACKSAIACSQDSDCGTNGDVGSLFCSSDDVFQKYRTHKCNNPGYESASCSYSDQDKEKQDCGVSGYAGNKYCYDEDVYQDYATKGCSNGACYSNTEKKKQAECGTYSCSDGKCNSPKPDLVIKDLIIQNIDDKTVTLAFTVENVGEVSAENIYWKVDTDSWDVNPERTVAVSLGAGKFARAYMMWTYSEPKAYYLPKVIVDHRELVDESDEDNNEESIRIDLI